MAEIEEHPARPGEPEERPRRGGWRTRLFVDLAPIRNSRRFGWVFGGYLVSFLGNQFTTVAVPFQIYTMTESSLAVGLVGLAQLGPLMLCSVLGGSLADAVDRRKLMMVTQVMMALTSVGLAVNASLGAPKLWPLYVLTGLQAGMSGIDSPTRTAVVPTIVRREDLTAAYALQQLGHQIGMAAGPALAGLVIAQAGLPFAFAFDAVTFTFAAFMLLPVGPLRPEGGGRRVDMESVREGWSYTRRHPVIQGVFVIDLNAMVFGMPRALFPAMAAEVFGGGAATTGLLYTAPGAGALVAAALSGWVTHVHRQGRAVLWAVAVWGVAVAAFGVVPWLWPALVLLGIAGAADVVSAVFRNTILQLSVPDSLRGRLSAVHIAVVAGGPRLGDARAGAVAALIGTAGSMVTGGLVCVAGVLWIARRWPTFAGYERDRAPA